MQQVPERRLERHVIEDEISRPHQILFHAADLAARRDLPELMQELSRRLHIIFDFRFTNYALHDADKNSMRVSLLDESLRVTDHEMEVSIDGSPSGWVWTNAERNAARVNLKQVFRASSSSLEKVVPHDAAVVSLWDDEEDSYESPALGPNQREAFSPWGWRVPRSESVTDAILVKKPEG